jgi:ATP-dependent RNA helicase DHX8/PRP22
VELQFKSAVKNNSFSILCSMEECAEPWAWKDISNLAVKTGIPVADLVDKATNTFVTQNKKEYRYCPTADCPIIYRVSEKEKLFSCTECEIRICTACHNQFHDGLTCKIVETKKTDDGGLKLWMEENAARAKYCPQCSTPIEKTYGCNHMKCLGCKAHICWVCLAYFTTGQECYGHMQEIHNTFV